MNTVRLQNIFLHVTRRRNFHCSYCYLSAGSTMPDELSAVEFSRLWLEIAALGELAVMDSREINKRFRLQYACR